MIVIDPGHGGFDPGGGTNEIWKEKDLSLDISRYQQDRFNQLGIPVKMTRETDETLTPKERVNRVNEAFGKNPNVVAISNHINKNAGMADGAEFIYSKDDSPALANSMAEEITKVGQNIRGVYQRLNSRGTDYYFVIRDTRPIQTIIAEYGFADSPDDDIYQLLYEWPDFAEAIVKATAEYLGYNYTLPTLKTYIVKPNESLYTIARNFNTSVEELIKINNLSEPGKLSAGQQLKIPSGRRMAQQEDFEYTTEEIFTIYTVRPRETLYDISEKLNVPVESLLSLNNLTDPENISPGQSLKIPTTKFRIYTVREGDTLYSIAQKFNTTLEVLIGVNRLLYPDYLFIGQKLIVPVRKFNTYKVKPGDTLYDIAQKFNTTVPILLSINDIPNPDVINVGQIIKVPSRGFLIYTVKPGDALYKIAEKFGTTVQKIVKDNMLISTMIFPGQKLIIKK